jgi:DNA invertase Pin-like site-specific DNA recombinase
LLAGLVRLIELLDQHNAYFVSVTQHFNTSSSMGMLTLYVPLSFAQSEREGTGERIRDLSAASRRKGSGSAVWHRGIRSQGQGPGGQSKGRRDRLCGRFPCFLLHVVVSVFGGRFV